MLYFVTGGQRSGKSHYAQQQALEFSSQPVYIATSRVWDEDFRKRVALHQEERKSGWENVEEEKYISRIDLAGKTAVIDCVTLWLTNFFFDCGESVEQALEEAKKEFDVFMEKNSRNANIFIISNEIGMGVHAETATGRKFTDLHGWMNQYIAQKADKVILMISGIPVPIK